MNQFKDVFTGKRKPDSPCATSVQKCIRAGGKHNDLDNVGFTARHHTLFEMLGNFSFGDYYKEEAITYAWDWVTNYLCLPKDRLYASVYEEDDESFELLERIAPELKNGRVMRFGKKDNYWSMGDIGPCGPNSEIHFDRGEKYGTGPEDRVNGETDRFVELWNLVFMKYDRQPDGKIAPLPMQSVDTGAGLERIAAIMQNVDSNYEIDIFQNLIKAVSELTGSRYRDNVPSHHVVADHVRALAFSLADGAGISNEGRGYVLRRILRRAARHGRELGAHEPFIHQLVPVLVDEMGDTYPEIREKQQHIINVIRAEEESFCCTLETGCELFSNVAERLKKTGAMVVPGADIFKLYDTYGFPYDLTETIATERGLTLDREGFDKAMAEQQERSRAAGKFESHSFHITGILDKEGVQHKPTEFVRGALAAEAEIQSAYRSQEATGQDNPHLFVILNRSPFYVEAGGQISDTGTLSNDNARIDVRSVLLHNDMHLHEGLLISGELDDFSGGTKVTASVDVDRRWDIMRNHTATHLAHKALRDVLGEHVRQSGSYVGDDRLRFDFSHHQPMTPDEIKLVEEIVNTEILKATDVTTKEMSVEDAKKSGAVALFGEKYGDTVRVVSVGDFSKELCGGTHVQNTAQIGPFIITIETGIASGVRRMEAVTGREAQKLMLENKEFRSRASALVNRPESEALEGIEQLKQTATSLQKELKKARTDAVAGKGQTAGQEVSVGKFNLWTHDFGETDRDSMSAWVDSRKEQKGSILVLGVGNADGKVAVMLGASAEAQKSGNVSAGKLAKQLLSEFGGRGGGKPGFAQGGVPNGTDTHKMFESLKKMLADME